ncbi:MAG TPA: ATP-dependent Clp protease proteolytic subunit [Pseudoneobacillus sp.]|jgi:ATP-dependent Clp protease protease subunit|nr:ATP-dependent Clp protease proteolytic subunit [Pseudoneobacillus sp.]
MKNDFFDLDLFEEDSPMSVDHLDERSIFILGEIDDGIYNTAIIPIMKMNEKEKNFKTHEPIKLYISSEGGMLYHALALIDVMRNSEIPVHTYCMGWAASAAFMILCAGHKRFAYKNASLMLHEASWGFNTDKVTTLKSNVKEIENIEKRMIDLFKEHTCITEGMYKENGSKEWWMDTQEALKLRVIDEIL